MTKASLSNTQIEKIFTNLSGSGKPDVIRELTDGCFNTSYFVSMGEGEEYVLKVAPPDDVTLLTYEQDLMRTEIAFYKKVSGRTAVPVPEIVKEDLTGTIIANSYFIMKKLQGLPLDKVEALSGEHRISLYRELAAHLAEMHRISGSHFGYPFMNDGSERNYFQSFCHMVDLILDNGADMNIELPVSEDGIRQLIMKYRYAFEDIKNPVFVHFDLWDGNIFVQHRGEKPEIEGLIDFERGFYGDPSADFSQCDGYIDLKENPWFFEEYNKYAAVPFIADEKAFVRIKLYRFYLFLIMIIESYYRDVNGSYDGQLKWSEEEFLKLYEALK